MFTTIECAGHPRDMGLAQGTALRASIREEVARLGLPLRRSRWPWLRGLTAGPWRSAGAGREMFRHFAHQSERLEGIARDAGVPMDSLIAMHLRVRAGGAEGGLLSRRAWLRARSAGSGEAGDKRAILERSLPAPMGGEAGWVLRESQPVVGFRSVEIALPWMVPAIAGLNEAGLAVMAGPVLWGPQGTAGNPPAILLVQECLQRFEDLDGALDWCCKRPVEGEQTFVLADASGATATVVSTGRERRVHPGEGELYLEGGELPAEAESEGAFLAEAVDQVVLDPTRRELHLRASGTTIQLDLANLNKD